MMILRITLTAAAALLADTCLQPTVLFTNSSDVGDESGDGMSGTGGETGDPMGESICGDGLVESGEDCESGLCCDNCTFRSPQERCAIDALHGIGCPWGVDAGSDVGLALRDQYCSGESSACDGDFDEPVIWQAIDECQAYEGCVDGLPTCQCSTVDYWYPTNIVDTDVGATKYEDGVPTVFTQTDLQLEFVESDVPGHLRVRICKVDEEVPNLLYSVHLYFEDDTGQIMLDEVLAKTGTPCSEYAEVVGEETYVEGLALNGVWRVVSPSDSANEWTYDCGQALPDAPTGFCWGGDHLPAIERTCMN